MAERIGSAYVRVFFRSSGEDLDDQIKKDKGFEKAGKTAGEKVGKGFDEEWVKQQRETLGNDKEINKFTGKYKRKMTELGKDLNKFWDKEAQRIEEGMGRPINDLDRDLVKLHDRFKQIGADLPNFSELSGQSDDLDRRWRELEQTMQNVAGWAAGVGESFKDSSSQVESSTKRMTSDTDGFFKRISVGWSNARKAQKETDQENGTFFQRWEKRSEGFSGFLSKMFGKGARNNFANLVGVIVSGLTSIPTLGLKAFGSIGETFGKDVTGPMEESAGMAEKLGGQLSGLAAMAPEIGVALGVALVGLPLLLSAVASLMMLITGAVIALAGALTFALIGAIGAVAGALVPLAAGIGVAMLAISNMDKKAKDAFRGSAGRSRTSAKVASNELFKNAADDAKVFEGVIKSLRPLVKAVAGALREVGENLSEGNLRSPGQEVHRLPDRHPARHGQADR